MGSPMTMRRPCFIEDDGLASVAVMEAGFSGNITNTNNNNTNTTQNYYYGHQNQQSFGQNGAPVMMMRRRNSLRNVSSLGSSSSVGGAVCSPRCGRLFYDARFEEPSSPHFLEACFLCRKPLGDNRDIFMYRGDTPFCSEECRQEQIEIDEAKEKNRNLKALRSKKETSKSSSSSSSSATSPDKNQSYPFRTGTVAAA